MNKRILIIGPSWVGDMVMAQSLFMLLKSRDGTVIIDVLAPAWSLPLLSRMPEVSKAISMPIGHGKLALGERYRIGKSLRDAAYDQAIVLPNSFKSALIPFFAKIPLRTGWLGEFRYGVLNDIRYLNKEKYPLMIERFMALGLSTNEKLPTTYPLPTLIPAKNPNITRKLILALCPGAEFGSAKRWPEKYYAEVANQKMEDGWEVWLLGSEKDKAACDEIMSLTQQRCKNLAGKTQLEEVIDLLDLATAVITNDSGLMHIAAALNKPLIAIYGPTSMKFTPPLNSKAKIAALALDCQPCFERECPLKHHHCMQQLTPHMILSLLNDEMK